MNDTPTKTPKSGPADAAKRSNAKVAAKVSKGINSVEVGVRVLNVLAQSDGPLALKEISRQSGLSPSQTHRYLASLIRQQMVVQDAMTGRYDLGRAAVRIGLAALNRLEPVRVAEEALDTLAEQIPETAMCAIWGETGPVAVRWKRGSRLLFASVGLGTTFPLLNSTTGRLFLAFMPTAATRSTLEAELAQAKAIGHDHAPEEIKRIITEILENGFAWARDHLAPGIWAASAPVFDSQGQLVAGLTIIGAVDDPSQAQRASVKALVAAARDASERLGASTRV